MKINIIFTDADAVYDAITRAINESISKMQLSEKEKKILVDIRRESIEEKLEKWIEFGEIIQIEFDLESMTALVKENK